ncbi:protein kinase domain-containing protein [Dokdonella sp.]|uniref:serine/threonine-protein kinase n=1 Tax=Dokdonella sp. TaxID=2291710 RepID=UPI003783B0FF
MTGQRVGPLSEGVADRLREALDLAVDDRAAWLDRIRVEDAALHSTLQRLLQLDARDDLVVDRSLDSLAANALQVCETTRTSERIGPYRLRRKLGEGGMGSVWLADRVEGGFSQQVALKLIRLGMDSAIVLAQFQRERELLAQLNHPDIARLLDGGLDVHGRPWFAMEYVEGSDLHEWIAHTDADTHARLDLFLRLCRAVAYAHQRLIVHRDLKPSNVRVRADGTPCLLDFGIARLVEVESAEDATTGHRFLTRAYAAPEQLSGGVLTTATDVFALGALLFELLTGLRYSSQRREDGAVTRPSAAVRTAAGTTSRHAGTLPLRGDLDAIVLRALAAEPQRRYAGAEALADDVERFLDGRPVVARPDSALYRIGKFARRNRLATAAAGVAVLAMIVGTAASLWQAQRAERMADRAERSKAFLAGLLEDANPFDDHPGRKAPPDRLLDNAIARIERDFADAPEVQIEMRQLIQMTLVRIGDPQRARLLAQRNADAARLRYGDDSPEFGVALANLGLDQEQSGDAKSAMATSTQAERLLRDAGPAYAREHISSMTSLAKLANARGDAAEALSLHEAVLRERQELDGLESRDVAMDLMNLSADAFYAERYDEAEALALRSHAMAVKLLGAEHARLIYVDNMLGLAQAHAGHVSEALATLNATERRARATLKPDAPMLGSVLGSLGTARYLAHDYDGALVALGESRRILSDSKQTMRGRVTLRLGLVQLALRRSEALATLEASRSELAESGGGAGYAACARAAYGVALARTGDAAGGEKEARGARQDVRAGKDAGSTRSGEIDLMLADLLQRPEQAQEALGLRREALAVYQRVLGPAHPRTRALAVLLGSRIDA